MNNFYDFDNNQVGALVYSLIGLGPNIKGAEIGCGTGQVSCCFLQKCSNIEKLYMIDPFLSHHDGVQEKFFDQKNMEYNRLCAHHNVKWSGHENKVEFLEIADTEALRVIPDHSLDFVFIDVWLEIDQIIPRIRSWEEKVRPGGIISGHDWFYPPMPGILEMYRQNKPLFNVNNTWMWYNIN